MSSGRALVLFTKPARPGRVKTRLIDGSDDGLTAEEAAALHWALVLDQVGRLEEADFALHVAWALEEGETPPDLGLPAVRQEGADLGERLYRGLRRACSGAACVAAVGSDHPELGREPIEEAFRRLEAGADIVLGPTSDGGYYLLALRCEHLAPGLFRGVPWSTARVLARTRELASERGLRVELLELGHDVDTPADLARLARRLQAGAAGSPRTRALLESWGLLT